MVAPLYQPVNRRLVLFLLLASLYGAAPSVAQLRVEVGGVITDTLGAGLPGATVVLMQETDSVMVSYGITNPEGTFRLRRVPAGDYLLQVTFVGLEPHLQPVAVVDTPVDVGRIIMREAVSELSTLVISTDRIPVMISSDTLKYNAAAFNVRPNANVEELLRRLPGIEVERDGSIRANGEEVEQVLVDGKEFFGNDPTVATRNLPADAVDQVQVYDKESDMAAFTGIDDGEESRTINLALKEDRRQGSFGSLSAGYGRDVDTGRYEGKANLNRFSPKTQLSLLGNLNNVNTQAFSTRQYLQFMGGLQALMNGNGGLTLQMPSRDGSDNGFTRTAVLGLNVNHDFGSKTTWRSSYLYNGLDNDQDQTVLQQQVTGATLSSTFRQTGIQNQTTNNQRLNINALHTLTEGHDLGLRANLVTTGASLTNDNQRDTRDAAEVLANSSTTAYASDAREWGGDATLTYRKRFSGSKTSIVADLRSRFNDGDADGTLNALNRFFEAGNVLTREEIAQLQRLQSTLWTNRARIALTHPFTNRFALQLRAEHRRVQEEQDKAFFEQIDQTPVRNEALSSALERTYAYNLGGLTARVNRKRHAFSIGAAVQHSTLEGTIRDADAHIDGSFVHLLPSATLRYEFSDGANVDVRYTTATREPSMGELQPFTDNSDPLNTYTGNPDLTPEYRHTAGVHFLFYDAFTFTNLFAYFQVGYTTNAIVRSRTIDAQFRQASTSVNAGDAWTLTGSLNFGTPLRFIGARLNVSNRLVYNRSLERINGAGNQAQILRNTIDLRLENRNKDRFDVVAGTRLTPNLARYSLNPDLSQSYLNRAFYAELRYNLGDTWRISTELDYRVFADEVSGEGQRIPLLQAEVSRLLLRQRAELQFVALDLLDQNVGVVFDNQPTYVRETRVNALGRYLMLKFVYNLSPR